MRDTHAPLALSAVAERLDVRDKCVAAGLAMGTGVVMLMLGLGVTFLLALAAAAPVLLRPPVRERLFRSGRETLQAYYVAWLYGPLGWGLYRGVRWAQILGAGLVVAVLLAVM